MSYKNKKNSSTIGINETVRVIFSTVVMVFLFSGIILSSPVRAFSCTQYANVSVTQNQEAEKLHCGLNPPIWSNDYQKHLK